MVTGAIRVQSSRIARSFIGRARENRALAELELMSSTSREVCELFNGKSIVRVMGKLNMAQLLIFPSDYDAEAVNLAKGLIKDASCGIHTLKTATDTGTLMQCVYHRSYSKGLILALLERLRLLHNKQKPTIEFSRLGPPNLQLRLSSDQSQKARRRKHGETFLAGVTSLIVQASLIAIATITVFYDPVGSLMPSKPEAYGFPVMLRDHFFCQSVRSRSRKDPEKRAAKSSGTRGVDTTPRLVWLQQDQEVSDQKFKGYAILAGAKQHIVSSSRLEDTRNLIKSVKPEEPIESTGKSEQTIEQDPLDTKMEFVTIAAAVAAGSGFVAQSMGLRGLPYPYSIAQVLGIFLMASVRVFIRRRLGRRPAHLAAPANHEVDLLATHIAYSPDLPRFTEGVEVLPLRGEPHREIFRWRVRTAHAQDANPTFIRGASNDSEAPEAPSSHLKFPNGDIASYKIVNEIFDENTNLTPDTLKRLTPASSQQLIRVRKRVGDLCEWQSDALHAAQSLVQGIEAFTDIFFPASSRTGRSNPSTAQLNELRWVIDTVSRSWPGLRADSVSVMLHRSAEHSKWRINIGQVDAILSLWLAAEMARLSEKEEDIGKQSRDDWRRKQAGLDVKHTYCRILGDDAEDGCLERNLA